MPIIKDGRASGIEILFGRKAKKVINRNKVKMKRKITNRFATHNKVFGIL
jgi:hypothetical protein